VELPNELANVDKRNREVEVIEMIDAIYPREKDRATLDVNAYEASRGAPRGVDYIVA
jgi:hypothetical protein